jgi:hypothetical protein
VKKIFAYAIMFLTLDNFLAHFPIIKMTKEDFVDRFTVMYAKPQTLKDIFDLVPGHRGPIIKKPETDKRYLNQEAIMEYFYEIVIRNRHKYLSLFYEAYFEFKDPGEMKWSGINIISAKSQFDHEVISLQKNDPSRRLIRNLFYLELLHLTRVSNTVKSHVSFWGALENMYNKLQLEDRFFAPSSIDLFLRDKGTKREQRAGIKEINHNNLFYLFQAYQPKASIFNPYSIKWILDNVIDKALGYKGKSIFTPVLSWGSYLAAFMHSEYDEYVGVDVMPSVCDKVEFLADWYQQKGMPFSQKSAKIRCQPSETLLQDHKFLSEYRDHFDAILVCPPYFDMEIYHEGPQSIELYPNYKQWLQMYWGQTVEMCAKVTKKGGVFAMIANDYKTLDNESFELVKDLDAIVSLHYTPVTAYYLQNRTSPLRVNAKDRTERLFIYRKAF